MSRANIGAALFTDRPLGRNLVFWASLLLTIAIIALSERYPEAGWGLIVTVPALGVALLDLVQTEHSLRRTFPVSARVRWFFEWLRPFLRAYIVESDLEGRPFSHGRI